MKHAWLLAWVSATFAAPASAVLWQQPAADELGGQAEVRLPISGAREIGGEQFALLEMSTPRDTYFAGEPIHVTLRFGMDVEFMQVNVLQLFTQTLDIPVQLQVPWIDELPGTRYRADRAPAPARHAPGRLSFVLNDSIAPALRVEDRERDGRKFAVFAIERTYFADASERLRVPAPHLRFACATRFEHNIISDSVPLDWQLASLTGNALDLRIRALPEEGRPADFTGAVGQLTLSAEVGASNVNVGESFKLALRIAGDGNLESLSPPRLDDLAGFHVRGVLDEQSPEQRLVTYDLAPLTADVKAVPPIAFPYFDTGDPAGYCTLHTLPIALIVRPAANGSDVVPPEVVETDARSTVDNGLGQMGFARWGPVVLLLTATIAGLVYLVLLIVRRRQHAESSARSEGNRR